MIDSTNLRWYLAGEGLGGRMGDPAPRSLDGLFGRVSSAEAMSGSVTYRCLYLANQDDSPWGLMSPTFFLVQADSPDVEFAIAIGEKNGMAEPIPDERSAPPGKEFSAPVSRVTGLVCATLLQFDSVAVWVRRTVAPNAADNPSVTARLLVEGDSV